MCTHIHITYTHIFIYNVLELLQMGLVQILEITKRSWVSRTVCIRRRQKVFLGHQTLGEKPSLDRKQAH